jgi:hypothetical protein
MGPFDRRTRTARPANRAGSIARIDPGESSSAHVRRAPVEVSLTGTAIDIEDTLAFSVLANIRAMIETVTPERAAEG